MESKQKVTTDGKHCGLCAYFREDGRCGNPREQNQERGYFEVACSSYDSGDPSASASPMALKTLFQSDTSAAVTAVLSFLRMKWLAALTDSSVCVNHVNRKCPAELARLSVKVKSKPKDHDNEIFPIVPHFGSSPSCCGAGEARQVRRSS